MRSTRKLMIVTAALAAAVVVFLLATLPPQPLTTEWTGDPAIPERTIAGAYHVHTTRSDGASSKASVADAAARAGLQFVIFTEHGDGTTPPDPPAYLSGVLCLDGVEISTNGGHYTAIDLPQTPFPLGGEADTVVDDVRRFGGFGFIAHPDSPRGELAWTDWSLPFDGVEWMNADSEWRNEPRPRMLRVLFDYLLRPGPALASLLDRPVMTLTRWDALTTRRPAVAMAGHDAHGGFGVGSEGGGWWGIPVPSYEASFRTFSTRVRLDGPLSGDAARDGRSLVDAIRAGRVHTVIDALASPGYLDFRAEEDGRIVVHASLPAGGEVVLLHADGGALGREVARGSSAELALPAAFRRGAFRVEVRAPFAPGEPPIPWLLSNPLYFHADSVALEDPESLVGDVPLEPRPEWHPEHDPSSSVSLEPMADELGVEFRLGGGERNSQFAAAVADFSGGMPAFDGLTFTATADRPMRVSVQLRYKDGDQRWGRSVFVDSSPNLIRIDAADLLPLDGQVSTAPSTTGVRSILFVVDLVNARPGDRGRFTITNLTLGRRP